MEKVRDFAELKKMHDSLSSMLDLITQDNGFQVTRDSHLLIRARRDLLCWVLKHQGGEIFNENMATLEKALADAGFELKLQTAEHKESKPN